jgi:uncharacterized protein YjbI with pentapeptide repeats
LPSAVSSLQSNFTGNEAHLELLLDCLERRSARRWNRWRSEHPRAVPDLRGVTLAGRNLRGYDLARARLDAANLRRVDLSGARLERASLREASLRFADLSFAHASHVDLSAAQLRNATLRRGTFEHATCREGTSFDHANLQAADFTKARMEEADLTSTDLSDAIFDRACLRSATLDYAILSGTSFLGAILREASVAGAFIRRVKTDARTDQSSLAVDVNVVWERHTGDIVEFSETNSLRVAQFYDIAEEHGSVADLIAANSRRVVLILGRFLPKRKRVLDRLADALRVRGKAPVIFDFPGPANRELSDTVRFIAGMSQFIVVDMTKASSVPLELQATIPDLMVPVLPIIEAGSNVFAMFADLERRYPWIQPTVAYRNAAHLTRYVDEAIIARAEAAARELEARRESSVRPPVSVGSFGRKTDRRR